MSDYREGLYLLPEHMRSSIRQWIEAPLPPELLGDFLGAVLSNDLIGAFGFADYINKASMQEWATFLYNYAPSQCHGSPGALQAWYDAHQAAKSEETTC